MKDYKKILEGVVNIISTTEKSDIGFANICSYIGENCPELKESEDERIRNFLISKMKEVGNVWKEYSAKDIIAWLEKQYADPIKEYWRGYNEGKQNILDKYAELEKQAKQPKQDNSDVNDYNNIDPHFGKPIDKIEPKFHEGDIIIHKELGGDYIHNSHKIIQVDILDKKYRLGGGLVAHFSEQDDYELVEQKPVPKFKIGDTMRTLQEAKDGWTDGMPFVVSIDSEYYNCNSEKIAIRDQDEYEYPPMNIRQKPAWSEEDEVELNGLIKHYEDGHVSTPQNRKTIKWLKSLKQRIGG